jgi:hypothetical protein
MRYLIIILVSLISSKGYTLDEVEYCRSVPSKEDMFLGDISTSDNSILKLNNPTCIMLPSMDYKAVYIDTVKLIDSKLKLSKDLKKQIRVKGETRFVISNNGIIEILLTVNGVNAL